MPAFRETGRLPEFERGLKIIYALFREEDKVELVEVYFMGDKENEDRDRILRKYAKGGS